MTTTSLMSTTMGQSSAVKDAINSSPDLHMSLQSVLELTPPSSAGFGDAGSAPTSSLDFDFSLDMSEIEGMDLESLENPQTSSHSDLTLPSTVMKDSKPCVEFLSSNSVNSSSHIARAQEMSDVNDRGTERSKYRFITLMMKKCFLEGSFVSFLFFNLKKSYNFLF